MRGYSLEYFNKALQDLQPPYGGNRLESIGSALNYCSSALDYLPEKYKTNSATASSVKRLNEIIDSFNYEDLRVGKILFTLSDQKELIEIIEVLRFLR